MLEIKNVYKTFNPNTINEKKALRGIDLVLNEGDFVTVIGGNGAGKSTMLNMIAGVYPVLLWRKSPWRKTTFCCTMRSSIISIPARIWMT